MKDPYYQDERVTLHLGDALSVAREMPPESVDCIVTSPPYYRLRDYGIEGQYGLESTPPEYIEAMRSVFSELRRVLASSGVLFLNLGDSYGKGKNLLGIPWQVALALQADGWILRNSIVWRKNAMPESVKDRFSRRHEMVFIFSRSAKYWFDLDPVREPHAESTIARAKRARLTAYAAPGQSPNRRSESTPNPLGANPGDVWDINVECFPEAHFATMPPALAQRCVLAGCKPDGIVLDPFSGSATTGLAALRVGRQYVGIDLNAEYLDLSLRTRLAQSLDLDAG